LANIWVLCKQVEEAEEFLDKAICCQCRILGNVTMYRREIGLRT